MENYRYKIDKKNNKKHECPQCGKKSFTRYISKKTGQDAGPKYGICSRIDNCRHVEYPPYEGDYNTYVDSMATMTAFYKKKTPKKRSYLNKEEYKSKIHQDFDNNNFCYYLHTQLGVKNAEQCIKKYMLGTSNHGAVIYPYFDINNNLVTYKTVHYVGATGKRDHALNSFYDSNKNKYDIPLFGSHLVNQYPDLPIGIVEGEKTAVMMSIYNPYILWLATGGAQMLNANKIKPIKDREIYLFPDAGCFYGKASWYDKMQKIRDEVPSVYIDISTEVEIWQQDNFIKVGDDIADYYNNAYRFCDQEQQMIRKEIVPIKPNMILHFNSGKISFDK